MKLRDAEDDIKPKPHLLMMTDTANEYKIYTNTNIALNARA